MSSQQQIMSSTPQHNTELPYLINVLTDDVVLEVGTAPSALGKLILKHYKVPYSLLLVGTPNCPFCARMAFTLDEAISQVKGNGQGTTPFFVYSLILTKSDPRAMDIESGLECNLYPALFIVDGRGDITPLIPNYMSFDEKDPMGNGRLQEPKDVLELMTRVQQQSTKRRIKQ